jgi:hypothetical protein
MRNGGCVWEDASEDSSRIYFLIHEKTNGSALSP